MGMPNCDILNKITRFLFAKQRMIEILNLIQLGDGYRASKFISEDIIIKLNLVVEQPNLFGGFASYCIHHTASYG
jgi:hypothetical protein